MCVSANDRALLTGALWTSAKRFLIQLVVLMLPAAAYGADSGGEAVKNYAPINDLRMYYTIQGAGPPLVLIHGGIGHGVKIVIIHVGKQAAHAQDLQAAKRAPKRRSISAMTCAVTASMDWLASISTQRCGSSRAIAKKPSRRRV